MSSLAEEFLADFESDEEEEEAEVQEKQNGEEEGGDENAMKIEKDVKIFKVPDLPKKHNNNNNNNNTVNNNKEFEKISTERLEDVAPLLFDTQIEQLVQQITERKKQLKDNNSELPTSTSSPSSEEKSGIITIEEEENEKQQQKHEGKDDDDDDDNDDKLQIEKKEENETEDYGLIVRCNALVLKIGEEMGRLHKFIRDQYAKKFPELESLVLNPLEYAKVVKLIGNMTSISKLEFGDLLPPPTIMIVKMAATASVSMKLILSDNDVTTLQSGCDGLLRLENIKGEILEFVESRMFKIAPNLTAIVGSAISARLIGIAGGLTALSRLPACNVQVLGSNKKTLEGFSTASTVKHVGVINDCDIITTTPPSLRKRAIRIIATKCVLAARIDSYHDSPNGVKGFELRKEIERKIEKWQEPPPPKQPKPLPAPDDKPKKSRGGKRKRRMKERYAISDLRKFANRMGFGVTNDEVGPASSITEDEKGLGGNIYGTGYVGHKPIKLHLLTDKKLSKRQAMIQEQQMKKKAMRSSATGTATGIATSGLSSTIAFTPVQGMELVDPNLLNAKPDDSKKKYFSGVGSFHNVRGGGNNNNNI